MLTLFKKPLAVCVAAAACTVGSSSYGWELKESKDQHDYGTWSPLVSYDSDGWASIANATYTGNSPSDGSLVTLKTVMRFCGEGSAAADGHAVVRMAEVENRPMLQVRSGGEWILAGAEGLVPQYDTEYTVEFAIDYASGRYSVKVGGKSLTTYESGASSFVLNGTPAMLQSVLYGGTAAFKSLEGSQSADNRTAWLGGSSDNWSDAGNWVGDNRNEPYFLENAMRGNRTVMFDSAQTIAGVVHVAGGTASCPLVFKAANADCGLSNGGKVFRVGENGDAVVRFENGKWNFGTMYVAMSDGLTAAVTNLNADLSLSTLTIASGKNSTGTFTQEDGTLTAASTLFVGNAEGANASFYNRGGVLTAGGYGICISGNNNCSGRSYFELSGGAVTNKGGQSNLAIGDRGTLGSYAEFKMTGGEYYAANGNIIVGGRTRGVVTMDGGRLAAANGIKFCTDTTYTDDKGPSTFALNGGVVEVKYVQHGSSTAVGEFTFNGGTLKAAAKGTLTQNHELLNVIVDEFGGTIDNGGFNVTLAKSMEGTGSLELTGSGVTTFTTNQLYTGATKIAEGTGIKSGTGNTEFAGTLVFTNGSRIVVAKNGSVCNCLSAADVALPSDGTVTVSFEGALPATACPILTKTDGTFRAADLVKFTNSNEKVTFHLALSLDRKSICIVPGGVSFVWTGAYDNNLLDERNWSGEGVPGASGASTEVNAVIGVPEATTLVCNGEFSPSSIVFLPDSAQVTINGSGRVTNVCEIANLASGVHHVFNVPVTFADGVEADVTLDPGRYIKFSGGLTAWDVKKGCGTDYYGKFNFIKQDIDWSKKDAVHVLQGSVTMNGGLNASNFGIYTGKSVYVNGDMPVSGEENTTKQLVWRVYGRLAVSNLITLSGGTNLKPAASYGSGAYAAKGLYNGSTGKFYLNTTHEGFSAHWEIGESGLAASGNSGGFHVYANSPATLNSLANYTISAPIDSDANARLKIGTGDVQDRTITVEGELKGGMTVELSGAGTVALNSVSTFTGGLVATNGVTLALGPNAKPGNGPVTMKDGTTLSACGNEIGGLSFAAGSTLDVVNPTAATPAVRVTGALTLPNADASVALRNDGEAFGAGTYAILEKSGVDAATGAKFAPVVEAGMEYRFMVDNGVLKLVVYSPADSYRWTGWGGDSNLSNPMNWMCGCVPGNDARLVFDSEMTVNADLIGGVTLSGLDLRAVVTFNGSLRTTADVDTSKIVVGENSTITLVGDLVFNGDGQAFVANKINDGGRLVVTGRIEARGTREVYPTVNGGNGYIVAKGLVNQSGMNDIAPFKLVRNAAGTVRWAIGQDGMDGRNDKTFWLLNNQNHPVAEIMPIASDFVVGSVIANRQKATLKFNTTGLDDNLGHTITVTNGIYREGPVHVNGTGKVLCKYVQTNSTNPFNVNGTATLELADGADIGRGGVTVNAGAKLEVSGGGATVGALTFKAGSTLKAAALQTGVAALLATSVALPSDGTVCLDVAEFSQGVSTGSYKLMECSGGIDQNAVGKFELSGCTLPEGLVCWLSVIDGTLYLMVNDPSNQVYVGSESSNLSDPAGWACGCVPVSGVAVMSNEVPVSLSVGNVFRPDTITFAENSGVVTIINGTLHLASLTNASKLAIGPAAALEIEGDFVAEVNVASTKSSFLHSNEGSVTVGGKAIGYANVGRASLFQYKVVSNDTKPIRAKGLGYYGDWGGQLYMLLCSDSNKAGMWIVGEDGMSYLNGRNASYSRFYAQGNGGDVTIYSSANWTLATLANGGTHGKVNQVNGDIWLNNKASLTLHTSDYDNPASTGHTITLNGRIITSDNAGTATIAGNGKVIVDTNFSAGVNPEELRHTCIATALAVTDTATLQINNGKKITGNGTVSFASGTTLAIPGNAEISTALSMARGSNIRLGAVNGNSAPLMVGGEFKVPGASDAKVSVRIGNDTVEPGTYTVLSAPIISASTGDFELANAAAGCTATFSTSGNALVVTVAAETPRGMALASPKGAMQAKGLARAGLLDLDPARTDAVGEVAIKAIRVDGNKVEVEVALVRKGVEKEEGGYTPINGVVKLYAVDLSSGSQTLVDQAVCGDPTFAKGDTATFTFETSVPAGFYRAVIEEE